jgi:hypothetical protein
MLADQKDICFASIDEGVISVVTSALEGQSKCDSARRRRGVFRGGT